MFTKFKTTSSVVFLDPHSEKAPEIAGGTKVDIVLSPSLYWVKKLSLPVKYARDAKKLLPSLFEDNLPEGNYSYVVFKEGEEFLAFAYEDKKIIEEIGKKNISISSINNVYFAQTELLELLPCKINEKEVMVVDNEIVFIAPRVWNETAEELSLDSLKLSKKTIKLQQFSHIIDNSSLYKVAVLIGMFIILLGIENFITMQKIESVNIQKEKLFEEYKLYPTMMQNRSVLQEYETTFEKQTKLRELIAEFLKLKLEKEQKITDIAYKNKMLSVKISGLDTAASKKVLQSLQSYKAALSSSFKGKTFEIKVKL
ncbi:hypothetical protein [Sulfurimonas marina]|uniref:Uncharacterized protein n=1 Tax=Sulfurimonas marina TaxID=2590551 RepID=A0A7M1AWB7_9BACT|nr:hypothetical protein [Sulfurimonas marina]QOP41720.1 hypothetical protein FJR03_08210 [Sulfurimonas marina]